MSLLCLEEEEAEVGEVGRGGESDMCASLSSSFEGIFTRTFRSEMRFSSRAGGDASDGRDAIGGDLDSAAIGGEEGEKEREEREEGD